MRTASNVDALLGLAEALISEDDTQLAGRAGLLVERALTLAPTSPKALFYGAAAAIQRKDLALARRRFVALLAENPPDNVRPIIQQQISAIDQALGTAPPATDAATAPRLRRVRRMVKRPASASTLRWRLRLSLTARVSHRCLCSCAIRAPRPRRWR